MKRFLVIFVVIFVCRRVSAQDTLSLRDCIIYALENNSGVKKQELTNDNYKQDKREAIASLFPSINANIGLNNNYGRSIDPATNTYTTVGNFGNTYYAQTQMPLFLGFQNINTIRVAHNMKLMGIEQLQQVKDELAINVMKAYYDVIYYLSTVAISKEQLSTSLTTLEQARKMEELGRKSAADLAQIESQVASEELFLTQQENKLELALLNLKQQMNFPTNGKLVIDPSVENTIANKDEQLSNLQIDDVVDYALKNNVKINVQENKIRQSQLHLYIAQGKYLPSIYANGGYSTNYYKQITGETISTNSFFNQIKDNRGYYFGASINIPIFNGLSRRTNVHKQKNMLKIAQQELSQTQMELKTEVTRVALELNGYKKEYLQASKKVEAAKLAHKASLEKFKQGIINPIDLQTTANQLLLAKSQQLSARLQLGINTKLLGYYSGEQLFE